MQCLPQRLDLFAGHTALGPVRRHQDVLDAARSASGADKADGRADADDAVNAAVGFLDGLDRVVARQIGNGRVSVLDLAFECRDEAFAHPAETLSIWIDGHDYDPRTAASRGLHAPVNIIWPCRIRISNMQLYLHTNTVFADRILSHILRNICTTTYVRPVLRARTTAPGSTTTPAEIGTLRAPGSDSLRSASAATWRAADTGAAQRYPCHPVIPRMTTSSGRHHLLVDCAAANKVSP